MAKTLPNGRRVKTGGRERGTPNKRTVELQAAMAEAVRLLGETMDGSHDALGLLQAVYKSPHFDLTIRMEAAKAAIRFEKSALAAIDAKVSAEIEHFIAIPVAERDAIPGMAICDASQQP